MNLYENCFYEKLFMRNMLMRSVFMINITEPYKLDCKGFFLDIYDCIEKKLWITYYEFIKTDISTNIYST